MAIAGPAVTLVITLVCLGVGSALEGASFWEAASFNEAAGVSGAAAVLAWLANVNALILLFNLLPAFPLDGGRIARAIAWRVTGDRESRDRLRGPPRPGLLVPVHRRRRAADVDDALLHLRSVAGRDRLDARPIGACDRGPQRARPADRRRLGGGRDGRGSGRDTGRCERRDRARRVLPPLPVAVVPGRRCRPPLRRPGQPRRRRRRAGAEPCLAARLGAARPGRGLQTSSGSATTRRSRACSATTSCAGSGRWPPSMRRDGCRG